ncbi:unnamed protein product [Psylliodes chrysocephalus]|uniref:Uncharacterized protein n=1 Tax=Psylliodes chrysocephalus TaxID=3402493 RepID=A0A9P0CY96_9CUCU|nr:unnamed protein product [Psylliodes chrysocephala]
MNKFKITPFKENVPNQSNLFPTPLRCLIIGKSGSGKTTILWNVITKYWIPYESLLIFTKSIDQSIYQELQEIFAGIDNIESHFYDNCDDIINVDECKPNSLVIFDDCILEKQQTIKDYFVRSRPKNISCIYLTQCYSMVNLQIIRTNSNFLIIFKQSQYYVKKIWEDFITEMTLNDFYTFCKQGWEYDYGFVCINLKNNKFYNKFENVS